MRGPIREGPNPENMELAEKVYKRVVYELRKEDDIEALEVVKALKKYKDAIIERIAIALDIMRPDPRGQQGTILIKVAEDNKRRLGVKLRFKAIDEVATKLGKIPIWIFLRWDLVNGKEGWRFQAEIDLTKGEPKLIRNIIKHKVKSMVIY